MRIGGNSTIEDMGRSGIAERFRRNDSLLRKKILSYLPFMLMTNLATLLLVSADGLVVGVIQVPITRLLIAAYHLSPDMQELVWQYSISGKSSKRAFRKPLMSPSWRFRRFS